MWCSKRSVLSVSRAIGCAPSPACERFSRFVESSPVEMFFTQRHLCGDHESIRVTSDIYMLFNQERLTRTQSEQFLKYLESLPECEPAMTALRSKLNDEQLSSFVKSRFIQSPSELMAWSNYLMNSQDAAIAAAAREESSPSPDASPSPEPTE